jgi:hypothetical protein
MAEASERCEACRFWWRTEAYSSTSYGRCRRRAPISVQTAQVAQGSCSGVVSAAHPQTPPDWWCGEYEPKADVPATVEARDDG